MWEQSTNRKWKGKFRTQQQQWIKLSISRFTALNTPQVLTCNLEVPPAAAGDSSNGLTTTDDVTSSSPGTHEDITCEVEFNMPSSMASRACIRSVALDAQDTQAERFACYSSHYFYNVSSHNHRWSVPTCLLYFKGLMWNSSQFFKVSVILFWIFGGSFINYSAIGLDKSNLSLISYKNT